MDCRKKRTHDFHLSNSTGDGDIHQEEEEQVWDVKSTGLCWSVQQASVPRHMCDHIKETAGHAHLEVLTWGS